MLTKQQIQANTQKFKDLVSEISRLSEEDVNQILTYLDSTDFFTAPASIKYHGAYEGGLCEHCLNVCENLHKLYDMFHFDLEQNDTDSLTIVSLFHDFAKVNFYFQEVKHRKIVDASGKSKWEDYYGYSVKEPKDRMILGNHEENSAYMVSTLIPLRSCEYSAILNHHGGMGWDSSKVNIADIFQYNPLAQYLYYADCIDAYDPAVRETT